MQQRAREHITGTRYLNERDADCCGLEFAHERFADGFDELMW